MAREAINTKIIHQLSDAQLVETYNAIPGARQITRFTERSSLVRRLELALESRGYKLARVPRQPGAFRIVPIGAASELRGAGALEKRITVLAAANPKQVGSRSHARFALYRDGMTMAEYMEAAVRLGVSYVKARKDIYWDRDRGHILLEE